jgi:preprotein translocase subunit SecD
MRLRLSLLPLVLLGLFIAACSGSSSQSSHPGSTSTPTPLKSGVRVLLVPTSGTSTQADLSSARKTLSLRLAAFGFNNASVVELTSGSQPALQVEVPHFGGDEHTILGTLLEVGQLAFWSTGPQPVTEGSTFDPTQFTQNNPAGKPHFTGADLDPAQIRVGNDQTGRSTILFAMKGPAIARFGAFTQQNIGTYLTLTLDLQVIQSAIIQSAINGPAQMTGNFTRQQAIALVSVLKYPPLPVVLHISSEIPF